MCREALDEFLKEVDKLYQVGQNACENLSKQTLEGFEMELVHLKARVRKDIKMLNEKLYQKEYRNG